MGSDSKNYIKRISKEVMEVEVIKGDGRLLENIDLAPNNVYQEVLQNVAIILDTVQRSCPMLRGLGVPGEYYGRPLNAIENMAVGMIYDQIETYEPRAELSEVRFEADHMTGKLIPVIVLEGVKEDG